MKKVLIAGCAMLFVASASSANTTVVKVDADSGVKKAETVKTYVAAKNSKRRKVVKRRGFWSLGAFR